MKHQSIGRILGVATAISLVAGSAAAQVPLTPRALGMGGAYVGTARGYETLFQNPANLALPGTPRWSLTFPQFAVGGTMLGPSVGDVPDLANFDDITEERSREILATIPASGTEFEYDVRVPVVAFSSGSFALGVSYGSIGEHSIGKDIVELIFDGYEEGRTDYSVGNTAGSRATFWDFAAGYGRRVGPLSVGVTGHYIRGGTILRSRLFEPRVNLEARDIEVDYLAVRAQGGTGYGVDVGAALQPTPSVTISGAISNVYSRMEWSEDLRIRELTLGRADFDGADFYDILDRYEDSEVAFDPTGAPVSAYETARDLYEEAYFPAVARVGAAWKGSTGTEVGASYQKAITGGRLADAWEQTTSVGVQQKLPLITVRAGYATNLEEGSLVSGGLTLGVLELGVAKLNDGEFESAVRSGWIATFGVGVRSF